MIDVFLVVEGADMQFVDDEFVIRSEMEVVPLPVEARIVNDGVAERAGHLTGIGIDTLAFALRREQEKSILIAGMSFGYIGIPIAVLLCFHGMLVAVPIVERSNHRYALCMGCPHPEGDSLRVQHRTHTLNFGGSTHGGLLLSAHLSLSASRTLTARTFIEKGLW